MRRIVHGGLPRRNLIFLNNFLWTESQAWWVTVLEKREPLLNTGCTRGIPILGADFAGRVVQ